jgi:hypothetical protein
MARFLSASGEIAMVNGGALVHAVILEKQEISVAKLDEIDGGIWIFE